MKKDHLDQLLSHTLKRNMEQIQDLKDMEIPDLMESMEKLQYRIKNEKKIVPLKLLAPIHTTKKRKYLKFLKRTAVILLFLLTSFLFSLLHETAEVRAFRFHVIKNFYTIRDKFIVIDNSMGEMKDRNVPDTEAPPIQDDEADHIVKVLTIEEAQKQLPFTLALPIYLPDEYVFNRLEWREYPTGKHMVDITYKGKNSDAMLQLQQTYIPLDISTSEKTFVQTESSDVTVLQIGHKEVILITAGTNFSSATWVLDSIRYDLAGTISEAELIKMIESMP